MQHEGKDVQMQADICGKPSRCEVTIIFTWHPRRGVTNATARVTQNCFCNASKKQRRKPNASTESSRGCNATTQSQRSALIRNKLREPQRRNAGHSLATRTRSSGRHGCRAARATMMHVVVIYMFRFLSLFLMLPSLVRPSVRLRINYVVLDMLGFGQVPEGPPWRRRRPTLPARSPLLPAAWGNLALSLVRVVLFRVALLLVGGDLNLGLRGRTDAKNKLLLRHGLDGEDCWD